MELKSKVLAALIEGEGSGGKIALKLGVSRNAVWKCIESLRRDGYDITATAGRGYVLGKDNLLSEAKVKHYLHSEWTIETLASTTSTNDVAKQRAAEGANRHAVIADRQTAGRGRLCRSFASPVGAGLYLTAVLRPRLTIADCGRVTAYAGVVTARAVEKLCGVKVDIKWVNDLYISGKKICGILTESAVSLESGMPEYLAIGIGVNILAGALPEELEGIATTLEHESGMRVDRCSLAAAILDGLSAMDSEILSDEFLDEYRARSCVIGRKVTVNGDYEATALDIDNDCSLILDRNGEKLKFSAGEVSVKTASLIREGSCHESALE